MKIRVFSFHVTLQLSTIRNRSIYAWHLHSPRLCSYTKRPKFNRNFCTRYENFNAFFFLICDWMNTDTIELCYAFVLYFFLLTNPNRFPEYPLASSFLHSSVFRLSWCLLGPPPPKSYTDPNSTLVCAPITHKNIEICPTPPPSQLYSLTYRYLYTVLSLEYA